MKKFLAIAALLVSAPAASQTPLLYCDGFVNKMYIHQSGELFILPSYRNDWMKVCNVKADWQGISPIVCQAWLTTLKDALSGNGTGTGTRMGITVQYVSMNTCSTLPTYADSPKPGYIMVKAQ